MVLFSLWFFVFNHTLLATAVLLSSAMVAATAEVLYLRQGSPCRQAEHCSDTAQMHH